MGDATKGVVVGEQENVLVRTPYGFAEVPLGTLHVLNELAVLPFIEL